MQRVQKCAQGVVRLLPSLPRPSVVWFPARRSHSGLLPARWRTRGAWSRPASAPGEVGLPSMAARGPEVTTRSRGSPRAASRPEPMSSGYRPRLIEPHEPGPPGSLRLRGRFPLSQSHSIPIGPFGIPGGVPRPGSRDQEGRLLNRVLRTVRSSTGRSGARSECVAEVLYVARSSCHECRARAVAKVQAEAGHQLQARTLLDTHNPCRRDLPVQPGL
ncbi:MAG: hypothetical protein QOD62_2571 [Actinomycetota bacterium]|nr:hypothetical protein [Actinomycetota bacterium]